MASLIYWSEPDRKSLDDIGAENKERKCRNEDELFRTLENAWNGLEKKTLEKLVSSMPNRCQMVINNNGLHTKY